MKNRMALIIISAVLGFVNTAEAAEYSDWTRIKYLFPYSDKLVFKTDYVNTAYSTCDSGARFALDATNPDYKTQAAALIAAFMANKEIKMYITQDSPACAAEVDRFLVR